MLDSKSVKTHISIKDIFEGKANRRFNFKKMKVKHVDHRRANLRTKYVGGEFAQVKVEHVDQQEENLEAKAQLQKSNGLGGGGWF
jgi:hypothetical protein